MCCVSESHLVCVPTRPFPSSESLWVPGRGVTLLSTSSAMLPAAWVPSTQMCSNYEAAWGLSFQSQYISGKAPWLKWPASHVTALLRSGCDPHLLLVQAASSAIFYQLGDTSSLGRRPPLAKQAVFTKLYNKNFPAGLNKSILSNFVNWRSSYT